MPPRLLLILLVVSACRSSSPPAPAPRDGGAGDAVVAPDSAVLDATAADSAPGDASVVTDASGHASVSFSVGISTGLSSNCSRSGADIVEVQVSLVGSSGSCVPIELHLQDGALPAPAPVNARSLCPSSPARFSCFEPDVKVTATGLAAGGYHLVVAGVVRDQVCWRGDASLGIGDTTDEQLLTLLRQDGC